jgi:hypothetical protein
MATITVRPGDLVTKDPSDEVVIVFDWDLENLAIGVTMSTSLFTITAIRPSADTGLTKDNESILAGLRKTQLRLKAGTMGALYEVANKIVTNETPAQTKERSFRVLVQDK